MIAVTERERAMILAILAQFAPGCRVLAFGSRCGDMRRLKPYSDLDLAIDAGKPLTMMQWGLLTEAFQESELPYRVDVVDYCGSTPNFRAIIDKSHEVLCE